MTDEKLPVRTEVEVLPADPSQKPIGFRCFEYQGVRVHRVTRDRDQNPTVVEESLTNLDDIQPGMELAVPALMGGYHLMTVERDEFGVLYAKGERLSAILEFAKDDRLAWVCGGLINLRGIKRLEVTR